MDNAKKLFSSIGLRIFLGVMITVVLQAVAALVARLLFPSALENISVQLIVSLVPMYVIGMPIMIFLLKTIPVEAPTIEAHKMGVGSILKAFVVGYTLMVLANYVGTFIGAIVERLVSGSVGTTNVVQQVALQGDIWLNIIPMVFIAPIYEEFIFRKMVIDRVSRYGQGIAIVVSALMFGIFHGNITQFVYAFALGLFFAYIYTKTGKLIYTVILHMLINFMGSVVSVLVVRQVDMDVLMSVTASGDTAALIEAVQSNLSGWMILFAYEIAVYAIVITGVIMLIVALVQKKFYVMPGISEIPKGKRFSTVICNVGMILFLIFFILLILYSTFGSLVTGA